MISASKRIKKKTALMAKSATKVVVGRALSYLPALRIIPQPSRKKGISVRITTKNEEEWIGLNLRSLKGFADEIVIADASTDRTPEIIEKTASKYGLNVKLFHLESDQTMGKTHEHAEHANITLKNTSYRWVLWWEGDFIAKESIIELKKEILNLNQSIYYAISLPAVNLEVDLFHQVKGNELNIQSRLHTYSENLYYEDKGRFETLRIPLYFRPIYKYALRGPFHIFHMASVKNAKKLLFREFWTDWRELRNYDKFPFLEDYVKYRIKVDWNIDNIDDAAKYFMNEVKCKNLVPYDSNRFGDLPKILKEELKNPKYKVIYENNRIIGRNDTI